MKSNDTILIEISKSGEMTKKQLEELGNEAFKVASRYGKLSSDYLLSVQEMSRAGYLNSNSMAELSVAAQGAGDMTAELANQYIIATDKAFKMNGSIETLTATLDGANNITNHNAVNMTELGTAMSIVGSQAASAGLEVNETTAAIATMIAVTQRSGSEMGNAFKGILMNLRQVSGDVGDGEDIIDAESLTKYEKACAELGVSLKEVRNGIVSLKEPMQIIKELSEEYTKLDETDARRANLLSAVGGKYRANALNSLLENYDMYSKMLDEYADGLGSMNEEAEKTANSWEGRLNALQNSIDSFFNTLTNKDAIMGGISFFDRLIQGAEKLTNSIGEIPVVLTALNSALVATNADYGITQIWNKDKGKVDVQGNIFGIDITNIKNMKKHFSEAEGVILQWNDKLKAGKTDLDAFENSLVQNNAQFKAYLSTCSKDAPASLEGYKNHLRAAGANTDALRLKTILLNSAITMLGGWAIQTIITGFYELSQVSETVAEKAKDLGNSFKTTTSDIDTYKSKIEDLYKTINDSNSSISAVTEARKNLMTIQDELIEKYGAEKETINIITDAINGQADAFDRLTEKQWQETKNQFNDTGFWEGTGNWLDGYGSNIDRMVDKMEHAREILSFSANDLDSGNFDDLVQQMEKLGWTYQSTLGGFVKEGNLKGIYSDILDIQNLVKDMDAPEGFLKDLTKDANSTKETLDDYGEIWDTYILHDVILENNELVQSWNDVNESYSEYKKVFESGDNDAQNNAIGRFSQSLNNVLDNSNVAESVKEYFRNMYPALTNEVEKWEFRYKILPDLDIHALKGKTQADILEMLQADGSQYGEDTFNSLLRMASDYGIVIGEDSEKIEQLIDLLVEWEILQGDIAHSNIPKEPVSFSDIFSLESVDDTLTNLGKISESIDTIQNAYKTLYDAIDEYNENGSFSVDTLQSVIALGDDWLDYLVDEDGALKLDKQSLEQLTQARLNDMRIQAINNVIDNVSKIEDDATANEYLKTTNYALADSYEEVAQKALESARAQMQAAVTAGTLSQANMDAAMNKATADISKINKLFANTSISGDSIMGGFGKGSSGSSSSTKSEFQETIDFFERRVEVLDDALSHLSTTMDNISGSFGKNNLIDAELSITGEKFNNYTDALAMYTQKANEAFTKIPADIASMVKDGAVALTDFVGDGNEEVVEAIKDYESWADKIQDCKKELTELQKEIRQLELEKFNNIMDDYENQFNLRGDSKDLISKQIDLLKAAGELVGESFFTAQIDQSKKQLELLENEKAQLVNQMSSAISSGRIQSGTEEWLEMVNALSDVDGSIIDCKKSIEEFDNSILELDTEIFNRIQDQFSNLDSEISNILDLFDEFEVSDDKGAWSKEGITQLGLLTQQYELAQYQVQQYNNEIDELNKQYLAGRYSATEYADKLAELSKGQWDAVNATESAKDALIALNETRIDNQIKGIEKEIDAYKKLIDAQIDALKAEKDLHDYQNSISDKTKSITDLERQIAAMKNDTSAATVAKRKKLEEQLAEAKRDLEETEYDHSVEVQEEALNKQYETYEETRNKEIDALKESLNDRETILAESFETVKDNAALVGQEIATIATKHGVTVSNALISSWQSGEKAIASYGEVLSQNTSAFIENIMGVENEVWNLQAQANTTADSLAWMFSTKADNLVNELTASYYAESNLAYMTNALQQSLVNTLERGYNVSSIVNALNSIEGAARSAKAAIDALNNMPTTPTVTNGQKKYEVYAYNTGKVLETLDHSPSPAELEKISSEHIGYNGISKLKVREVAAYASGTRNAKEGLRIVNEEGSELVLPKLSSGNYAIGNAGDQILTKVETDNIHDWSKLNPDDLVPVDIGSFLDGLRKMSMPQVMPNNVNNNAVNVHYDSMFKIEGDVIDADRITKQMERAAKKISHNEIIDFVGDLADGIRYGGDPTKWNIKY